MGRIEINTNITTHHTQRHSVTIRTPSHITNGFLEVKKQGTIDIFCGMTDLLSRVCVPDVPVIECVFVNSSDIKTSNKTYILPSSLPAIKYRPSGDTTHDNFRAKSIFFRPAKRFEIAFGDMVSCA